jgi:hypothetical protein
MISLIYFIQNTFDLYLPFIKTTLININLWKNKF